MNFGTKKPNNLFKNVYFMIGKIMLCKYYKQAKNNFNIKSIK